MIPSNLVSKYYQTNPRTETLIEAQFLENGMIALVHSSELRSHIHDSNDDNETEMANEANRWCVVTDIEKTSDSNRVSFLGRYSDGFELGRTSMRDEVWIVKNTSVSVRKAIPEFDIPEDIVDKFYRMNPITDGILFDGNGLKNEMVVLLESYDHRVLGPEEKIRILNRWCRVSEVRMVANGHQVAFIATYADGTQTKRVHDTVRPWLVKKNSIPIETKEQKAENELNPHRIIVRTLVSGISIELH